MKMQKLTFHQFYHLKPWRTNHGVPQPMKASPMLSLNKRFAILKHLLFSYKRPYMYISMKSYKYKSYCIRILLDSKGGQRNSGLRAPSAASRPTAGASLADAAAQRRVFGAFCYPKKTCCCFPIVSPKP